jgi:enterochelin esterase-like enzyme
VALVAVAVLVGLIAGEQRSEARGARVISFTIHSRYVGRDLEEKGVIPAATTALHPLLVFLHGRKGHPGDIFTPAFFAELARLGARAPAVVEVNGDHHSYYHDRSSGAWGSYVMREAIPVALRLLHADPRRIAIGGISMGGFGAFDLARLHPGRFCAVGGHSPAIFLNARDTARGAFDDAADFDRHDVYRYATSGRDPYAGIPVWIDHGTRDPFGPADDAFARALERRGTHVTQHVWPGGHYDSYWFAHIASYLRFYAVALARC